MKTNFAFLMILVVVATGCAQSGQGSPQTPVPQPQDAARQAMSTLQQLVTDQNYRGMGFESRDEVKNASLGEPLPMFNINLDRLKAYRPGADVNALLSASSDTIYPITSNGQVRSSVTVTKAEGGYTASSFGNAAVVQALSRYRQAPNSFVVRVPALNMYYLGTRGEARLMLTPIVDDTRLKLQTGVAVPAEQVIEQLVPIANSYNGLPL